MDWLYRLLGFKKLRTGVGCLQLVRVYHGGGDDYFELTVADAFRISPSICRKGRLWVK